MICEGCIKQDVCKYQARVREYEANTAAIEMGEPLRVEVACKYKETRSYCDTDTPWDRGAVYNDMTASYRI